MYVTELLKKYPALTPYLVHMPPELQCCYEMRYFPPGYILHQKDNPLETAGILCEGTLKVINEFDTGDAYMIEYNHAIDLIGEVTILAKKNTVSVTIEAVTACAVLMLSRCDFERWLDLDAHFLRMVAEGVASKLYNSSYKHGIELFYPSPRLMLDFLHRYAQEHLSDEQGFIKVSDTRRQLSEQLGMLPKTIDRTIKRLKDINLISTEKGKIYMDEQQRCAIEKRLLEWID